MLEWLKGKKTYLIVATTFTVGGLMACGVAIPEYILALLAALGLWAARTGAVKK